MLRIYVYLCTCDVRYVRMYYCGAYYMFISVSFQTPCVIDITYPCIIFTNMHYLRSNCLYIVTYVRTYTYVRIA